MQSIFTDKKKKPDDTDLQNALGKTIALWKNIEEFTCEKYPGAIVEWNYSGEKYGWSFRIKDKKRAIVYLLPRDGFFKVALVFGEKALKTLEASDVTDIIKTELRNTKKYAEGKGIRLEVRKKKDLENIKLMIAIKVAH